MRYVHMAPNFELSAAESRTITEVRKLLGDNLADFLLFGLGDSAIVHHRVFTTLSIHVHSHEIAYQLEMINNSESGLAVGRDPLVLAALLELLWERQPLESVMLFRESDILDRLQWPHNAESQSIIRGALERYVLTAYCLIDPSVAEEERPLGRYTGIGRVLSGYEVASLERPSDRAGQLRFATRQPGWKRAQFLQGLIPDVSSDRKYFLGRLCCGKDYARLRPEMYAGLGALQLACEVYHVVPRLYVLEGSWVFRCYRVHLWNRFIDSLRHRLG
jgi:hypothetical protein